jgi:DNA-binding response OmpR family regulator
VARILIADDSADVRRLIAATLARSGHHVTQAPDGQRALDILATEPFEVAILDVMMPGVDGLTLCRMLRDAQGLGHLAVVIISGSTSEVAALAAGADIFLSKPFLPSTMVKVVASLLDTARDEGAEQPHSPHEAPGRSDTSPPPSSTMRRHVSSFDGTR